MKTKILVMGATGRASNETVSQLLAKGFPVGAFIKVNDHHRINKLRQSILVR